MIKSTHKKTFLAIFLIFLLALSTFFSLLGSNIVQIKNSGISEEVIYIFLAIPIITCFISFARHFIGINISNFYLPILLLISLSSLGLAQTSIVLGLSWLTVTFFKFFLKNYHLHPTSRHSLTLSFSSIVLLLVLPLLTEINLLQNSKTNVFILLLILVLLIEKFINIQAKFNLKKEFYFIVRNLLFAVVLMILIGISVNLSFIEIQTDFLKKIILTYPDLTLFISLIFNIIIGQYSGLRLDEFIRFRALINKK